MDLSFFKKKLRKDNPRWVILLIDVMIVFGCYVTFSFILNSFLGIFDTTLMFKQSLLVLLAYLGAFLFMKTYREIVRHTGLSEAIRIFKTVWLACMVLFVATLLVRSIKMEDSALR